MVRHEAEPKVEGRCNAAREEQHHQWRWSKRRDTLCGGMSVTIGRNVTRACELIDNNGYTAEPIHQSRKLTTRSMDSSPLGNTTKGVAIGRSDETPCA